MWTIQIIVQLGQSAAVVVAYNLWATIEMQFTFRLVINWNLWGYARQSVHVHIVHHIQSSTNMQIN